VPLNSKTGFKSELMNYIKKIKSLGQFLKDADHIDVKVATGSVTMREFIASMLSFESWWIVTLYRIRGVFVRILGLEKQDLPDEPFYLRPEDVSMTPGENAAFFIVRAAEDGKYWVAETPVDKHLLAYLGVAVEPVDDGIKRFHVFTVVRYKHWTGPVYFNIIRPFHHLVVGRMIWAGVRGK